MIVYDGLKSDFLKSVQEDTLAEEIEQCVLQRLGQGVVLCTADRYGFS